MWACGTPRKQSIDNLDLGVGALTMAPGDFLGPGCLVGPPSEPVMAMGAGPRELWGPLQRHVFTGPAIWTSTPDSSVSGFPLCEPQGWYMNTRGALWAGVPRGPL